MIVLSGASLVLPDRILSPGTIVIDDGRVVEISLGIVDRAPAFAFHNHYIVPGFVDVHVHGVEGIDVQESEDAIQAMATRLPRFGVTAFSPTTVACRPDVLIRVLDAVGRARRTPSARSARVLAAHLESNFINPEYGGAQPRECIHNARAALERWSSRGRPAVGSHDEPLAGIEILNAIDARSPDVGIVTLAPELEGGLDLIAWCQTRDCRVSVGHSGATYEQTLEAIAAGVKQATHLFNRMPPLGHRAPGLVGAVLETEEVAAEIICDGFHVHPALVRTVVAAKHPSRVMAITDGTAVSGLPRGARANLGGRSIVAGDVGAFLDDGTLAGSVLTMDGAFRMLVTSIGLSMVDAVTLCATTPAREMGLVGYGVLAEGAAADLVVLDERLEVAQTYVDGQLAYARTT